MVFRRGTKYIKGFQTGDLRKSQSEGPFALAGFLAKGYRGLCFPCFWDTMWRERNLYCMGSVFLPREGETGPAGAAIIEEQAAEREIRVETTRHSWIHRFDRAKHTLHC